MLLHPGLDSHFKVWLLYRRVTASCLSEFIRPTLLLTVLQLKFPSIWKPAHMTPEYLIILYAIYYSTNELSTVRNHTLLAVRSPQDIWFFLDNFWRTSDIYTLNIFLNQVDMLSFTHSFNSSNFSLLNSLLRFALCSLPKTEILS